MFEMLINKAPERLWKRFQGCIESEAAEEFLQILLTLMKIMFMVKPGYRQNIRNFQGRYQFNSTDGSITMAALFDNGRMDVEEMVIDNPDITVTFSDGRALFNFLLSPRQDILGSMLRHEVQTEGNLNYLYKFGYLAKQLQQMVPQP